MNLRIDAMIWLPVLFLFISVPLLIRAQERVPRDIRQTWIWKPVSSALVIAVGALSLAQPPGAHDVIYTALILGGLLLSFAGDLLLIPPDNGRAFLAGLVAFLLAHVAYMAAFVYLHASRGFAFDVASDIVHAGALTLAAVGVYRYLGPGLGAMRLPVIAYMLVISAMVHRALAIAFAHPGGALQPLLIAAGALLFYLSDAVLAINRFRFGNRLRGGKLANLSTYYLGQVFIALSASFFA